MAESPDLFALQLEQVSTLLKDGHFAGQENDVLERLRLLKLAIAQPAMTDGVTVVEPAVLEDLSPRAALEEATPIIYRLTTDSSTNLQDFNVFTVTKHERDDIHIYNGPSFASYDTDLDQLAEIMDDAGYVSSEPERWEEQALCAQTDPELFFSKYAEDKRTAKQVCSNCAVKFECIDYVLACNENLLGVWGGLSESDRSGLQPKENV